MTHILIVDDHEDIQRMIKRHFERMDIQCTAVSSGKEALELLREPHDVDAMLIDQMMPDMDGLETIQSMQKELVAVPPALMITAYGTTTLAVEFMKQGGMDFIQKPIDFDVLYLKIKKVLEKAKLEEQLRCTEVQQAAERETRELKDTFLAMMGHKLRTPLQGILGFTQLAQKFYQNMEVENPDLQEALGQILHSGQRLHELLENILKLTLAEYETGLEFQSIDINAMLQNFQASEEFAKKTDVHLGFEIPPHLPLLEGNQEAILEILSQLIDNGIKFTEHGSVTLRISTEDGQMIFAVTDTGVGVPEEDQQRIFDLFVTLDPSGNVPGVGLGLYLVQKLTTCMGGRLWLESQAGQGSTFYVSLPLSQ